MDPILSVFIPRRSGLKKKEKKKRKRQVELLFLFIKKVAHLIMGDGNLKTPDQIVPSWAFGPRVAARRIYTNSFTKSEVELLAAAITQKLGIVAKATLDRKCQYMVTISKSQLSSVIAQLKTHMHSSMSYKLGLQPEECISDVQELDFTPS